MTQNRDDPMLLQDNVRPSNSTSYAAKVSKPGLRGFAISSLPLSKAIPRLASFLKKSGLIKEYKILIYTLLINDNVCHVIEALLKY